MSSEDSIVIYNGGGDNINLCVGGATQFSINLTEIRASIDPNDFTQVAYAFGLDSQNEEDLIGELVRWYTMTNDQFQINCIRKFKLFWPYSIALRGIFMDICDYFSSIVKQIYEKHGLNFTDMEYKNRKELTESSCPALYGFTRDTDLPDQVKSIINKYHWEYPGFCPYESTLRFAKLVCFPLNDLLEYLGLPKKEELELPDHSIAQPKLRKKTYKGVRINPKKSIKLEKIVTLLLTRLKDSQKDLESWEQYYIDSVKSLEKLIPEVKKYIER
jgi:hypothetical protein